MNAASVGERAAQLSEQLFAYVRSAGFLCSDSGVVRLADRRIGVRRIGVRIYARHNGECVLVQGRNRRVFVRRSAHGSMIRSTYPSARLQLLAALFLEEAAKISQVQATPVSEGESFRDRVRIGVRALLEQKGIEPDKINELQEAIVDVAEKARLGAKAVQS